MTKVELVKLLWDATDLNARQAEECLNRLGDIVAAELLAGGEISLPGMGKLKARKVKARIGRNPRTGQAVAIAGGLRVAFVPGKEFKAALKN